MRIRVPVEISAVLDDSTPATIKNISGEGCHIAVEASGLPQFKEGHNLKIKIGDMVLSAQIAFINTGLGVEFVNMNSKQRVFIQNLISKAQNQT